MELLSLAL